jgi:hypothetical protein
LLSLIKLSVKKISNKMVLIPTERLNAKIGIGEDLFVEKLMPTSEFVIVRTRKYPNRFLLDKRSFNDVFGLTIEQYNQNLVKTAKMIAQAYKELKEEGEQDAV